MKSTAQKIYAAIIVFAALGACSLPDSPPSKQEKAQQAQAEAINAVDPIAQDESEASQYQSAYRDYIVVHNTDAEVFSKELNAKLAQGYLPQGAMLTAYSRGDVEYIQQLAKPRN